jgi:hypothetical protein
MTMAGGIGRILGALVSAAVARQKYRALHRVGLRGWKGGLVRVVGRMAGDAWNRRKQPQAPLRRPVRKPQGF